VLATSAWWWGWPSSRRCSRPTSRTRQVPAQEAIASLVLDAPLLPDNKIALAQALGAS
jgi:hypothetical protein